MKRFLAAFLLLLAQFLQAQTLNTDSLKSVIESTTADSTRVFTLLRLSLNYYYSKPDTAMTYALKALAVADKSSFVVGQTQSLGIIANLYFEKGNYIKALETHFKNLDIQERRKNLLGVAGTYNNIALIYQEQEDYSSALTYYTKAKEIFQLKKRKEDLQTTLLNIGNVYEIIDQLDSALFYETRAYQLGIQLKDQYNMGAILTNLGNISYKQRKPTLALQQYRESIPFAVSTADFQTLGDAQYGLARIYQEEHSIDSSIHYAKNALANYGNVEFPKGVANASAILSQLYEMQHETDSAYLYFKKATLTRDSLFNAEMVRKVQVISNNEQLRKKEIETAKITYRNRLILILSLAALGILLLLSVGLYRNNRQKQKANGLLQQKNQEIELQRTKAENALTELKAAQQQLVQREKMASLGELTAGIAHEIQNPLNFVNNFSDVTIELVNEAKEDARHGNTNDVLSCLEDVVLNLQKIAHHGRRADAIVKSMMEHSRSSKGDKQLTNLNALTEEYLKLAMHGFRAKNDAFNVILETHYDNAVGTVKISSQDIGRVLLNLFNNAFYAVAEKKKLLNGTFEPTVYVSTRKTENAVEISVKDNGTGIPEKVLTKIYQPFFTTKPTGEGTGLGLSLSYDIVTKGHGGNLSVESSEGQGSEFTVQFPIA